MYLSINDETNFVILAQQFTELCDVALQCLTSGLAHHITPHNKPVQFSYKSKVTSSLGTSAQNSVSHLVRWRHFFKLKKRVE